jgi:hypothetical protein
MCVPVLQDITKKYLSLFFRWITSPEGLDSWIFLQDLSIGLHGFQNTPQMVVNG